MSEPEPLPQVPRGPAVSPHQVPSVWPWWHEEIAPWKSLILGAVGHEARRSDTLPPLQQFY